jgi:hypothetical protein
MSNVSVTSVGTRGTNVTVSGTAQPGAEVEIRAGTKVLAKVDHAADDGTWTVSFTLDPSRMDVRDWSGARSVPVFSSTPGSPPPPPRQA